MDALLPQIRRAGAQLVVVPSCTDMELVTLRKRLPGIRFLRSEAGMEMAELKRLGAAEATGDIIAFTDDSCVVDDAWLEPLPR